MPITAKYTPAWCRDQAMRLLDFHAAAINPNGGFHTLDRRGRPLPDTTRALHDTCRMVYSYVLGDDLGHPQAWPVVDHGMRYLFDAHLDRDHGGFFWSLDDNGPVDSRKQAYGHAFVLLAAAAAAKLGHPDAEDLRDLAMGAILGHFWDDTHGAVSDTFDADWTGGPDYRGQNANMHLTESLLDAYGVWGDPAFLDMAQRISELIINRHARACGWVVAEHFTPDWRIDRDFDGDAMFRPSGTTPGHAVEWSRLLVGLIAATHGGQPWMAEAAEALFRNAVRDGWLPGGGMAYTLDWSNAVSRDWRFWWPCAETIGAAQVLHRLTEDPFYEEWYGKVWAHADAHLIDHENGGWFHEIDADGRPRETVFRGKPDIYHALNACVISAG